MEANDYYPFGQVMPGRTYQLGSKKFRWGMGGQEKDDDVATGLYTAEFWEYDARLARRWNIDPIQYAWQSPYACFNDNPIYFIDPKGLEGGDPKQGDTRVYTDPNGRSQNQIFSGGEWCPYYGLNQHVCTTQKTRGTLTATPRLSFKIFQTFTKCFNKVSSWLNDKWQGITDWFKNADFVFDVSGKVDIGAHIGYNLRSGLVTSGFDASIATIDLVSGHADLTELNSNNPDSYGGEYVGDGNGAKVTQNLNLYAGIVGQNLNCEVFNHSFRTHGEGYFDENTSFFNVSFKPKLSKKKSKDVENDVLKGTETIHSPHYKQPKIGETEEKFYGVDVGAAAAFILGLEVRLKIGVKTK